MKLKDNLRFFRESKNLKQSDLAALLSVSVKTISHWETGYSEPSILQLTQLADIFEVSLDELVGRNN